MNKVLNRPLFRKEALRRGALKPIHAQTGIMVGQPITNPNPQINPRTPVPAVRPGLMRRAVGDLRAFAQRPGQFFSPKVNRFVPGAGTAMFFGVEGLAPIIGAGRRKLGVSDDSAIAPLIDYGLGGLLTLTPFGRAVGLTALAGRTALGAKDYVQGKKIGTTMSALTPDLGEPLGLFDRPEPGGTLRRKQRRGEIDAITLADIDRVEKEGFKVSPRKRARQKTTDLATLPQNTTEIGKQKTIDTAKIAENAITPNPQLNFPITSSPEQPQQPQAGVVTLGDIEKKAKEQQTKVTGSTADLDSIRANSPIMEQLKLAKQIRDELQEGKSSQAKLVFLSNLASGLLTGTTKKAGIGGALEVFGQALGPAVNNMVMTKMKEDEIEQNLMGRALEFSTDFIKAQNEAYEMPEVEEVGVIQIQNSNGRITNVPGIMLKDGTKRIATGQMDSRGQNIYATVPPDLNFIANKDQNKETLELASDIAGKYAAVNLINRSLGIITEGRAEAGVTGAIGLYGGRLTQALGDVFDFVKPSGDSKSELKTSGKAMFDLERQRAAQRLVNSGEFDDKQAALKYLNTSLGTFEKNYNNSLRNAKKRLEGGSTLDYERLAINETVLVYKLANSLKSKDRLTQKDIEMAKGLVKVFPLLRGEKNVIASLTATAETILDDIRQQERLYERAGGSSQYLLNERKAYGLLPPNATLDSMGRLESEEFKKQKKKIDEMSEEDFEKMFPGL